MPEAEAQMRSSLTVGCCAEWDGGVPMGSPSEALGKRSNKPSVTRAEKRK